MSEAPTATPVEPVAPAATVEPIPTEGATPEPDTAAERDKWKAMARKHEAEAKANADKAKQFDALQAASQTDLEKAQTAKDEAAAEAAALRAELAIAKAAVQYGLDADDLVALEGVPADKVESIAARLAAKKAAVPTVPSALGQGNVGTPIVGETDPIKQLDAQIAEADKVRNFTRAIQLKRERATLVAAKN